jgi:hypothetical protein
MNDLTEDRDRGSIVPAAPAAPSRSRTVTQTKSDIERSLIKPMTAHWDLHTAHPGWSTAFFGARDMALRGGPWGGYARENAAAALAAMPSTEELSAVEAMLEGVVQATPDRAKVKVILSLMIDSFPNGRPADVATYLETLVHYAMHDRLSPHVVALTCKEIERTAKFLPAVSEFLEQAGKLNNAQSMLERTTQAIDVRRRLEEGLAMPMAPPPRATVWEPPATIEEAFGAAPLGQKPSDPPQPRYASPQEMAAALRGSVAMPEENNDDE